MFLSSFGFCASLQTGYENKDLKQGKRVLEHRALLEPSLVQQKNIC